MQYLALKPGGERGVELGRAYTLIPVVSGGRRPRPIWGLGYFPRLILPPFQRRPFHYSVSLTTPRGQKRPSALSIIERNPSRLPVEKQQPLPREKVGLIAK